MKSNEELINHILNAKATIILLTVGLIKMSVKYVNIFQNQNL